MPMMSVQPIIYIPVPQPLPPPGNTPNQPGDGHQQPPFYPTLPPGPSGPYFQPSIISAPPPNNPVPFVISTKKARALIVLGIAQVVLGILSIIFNGVSYYVHTTYTRYGPGFWAGVPFVVSGAIGIAAGVQKTKAMVITTLVLAILGAVLAAVQFSLAAVGLDINEAVHYSSYYRGYSYGYYDYGYHWGKARFRGAMAVDSLLLIFAILQAGVAIPSSALACNSLCCKQAKHTTTPVNHSTTGAVQYAYYPHPGAYYNPQMAYPMQFQPYSGPINYPQMSGQVSNSQTVSPTGVQISAATGQEAPPAPSGGPKEQRF